MASIFHPQSAPAPASILRPLQVQGPAQAFSQSASAIGAYEQLQAMRDARADRDAARRAQQAEAQRLAMVRQLQGQAALGDTGAMRQLVAVAPQEGIKLQEQLQGLQTGAIGVERGRAELGQVEQKTRDVQRSERSRQTGVLRRALGIVKADPSRYAEVRQTLIARGFMPAEALPETQPTPEQLAEFEASLDFSEAMERDPEARRKLTGKAAMIAEAHGQGTPAYQEALQSLLRDEQDLLRAKAERARRPSSPLIQFGGASKVTQSRIEKEEADRQNAVARINEMWELEPHFDDVLTYWGKGETALLKLGDKLGWLEPGSESAQRLVIAQNMEARIKNFYLPFKLKMTGAAAGVKEMEDIAAASISGNLGPVAFRAALTELSNMSLLAHEIDMRILREGIDPYEQPERYTRLHNRYWREMRGKRSSGGFLRSLRDGNTGAQRQGATGAAPLPGQPAMIRSPGEAPREVAPETAPLVGTGHGAFRPRGLDASGESRAGAESIDDFKARLRRRKTVPAPQPAGPQGRAAPQPAGPRGRAAPGQVSNDDLVRIMQSFGGDRAALQRMVREGYIDQGFADRLLEGYSGQ